MKILQTMAEGDFWDPTVKYNLTIKTMDTNYEDNDKFTLKLQFSNDLGHDIWKNYFFPDVKVTVSCRLCFRRRSSLGILIQGQRFHLRLRET